MSGPVRPERAVLLELDLLLAKIEQLTGEGNRERYDTDERHRRHSFVGLAERITIAGSTRYFTEPDAFFYENTRHAPVVIGDNTWLAPGVAVTAGASIGSYCILGANAAGAV